MANLAELLGRAAQEAPEGVALVDAATGASTTWAALDQTVTRAAHGLGRLGLVAGNRVVLATGNRTELVVAYLAALRAQLVAVPVNPRSATGELLRMVTDSRARLVVADRGTVDAVRSVVEAVGDARDRADEEVRARTVVPRVVTLDPPPGAGETSFEELLDGTPDDPRDDPPPPLPVARDPEALAVLLYTSGTSTTPRAAMLSHRALLANLEQAAASDPPPVVAEDVVHGFLPLHHVYGLNAVLGQVLRQHATLLVSDGFDPEGTLAEVERYGVTVLPVAPPVLAHWRRVDGLGRRLAGVRTVLSGSAPLAPELVTELQETAGLRVHQGYGLTEAAPVVTSTLGRPAKPGSVGAPLPGVELRLVDDTGGTPAGEDPGEIWIRGDNLFDGYWPDRADGPVDGWFGTGDVGFLDGDGDLFLVDRLREIVVVSGFNVYPSEIEEVLLEVDGVREAAVVGVPAEETGEAVVAYVATSLTGDDERADLVARIDELCGRRLARFKQPQRVEVVDLLPHTVTGKIAKGRLRSTLRRERTGLVE